MGQKFLFLQKDWNALDAEVEALIRVVKELFLDQAEAMKMDKRNEAFGNAPPYIPDLDVQRARLKELLLVLENSRIIENPEGACSMVRIGSKVTIITSPPDNPDDLYEEVLIMGSYRVLEPKHHNELSYGAPRVAPLLGKKVGDMVDLMIPGGMLEAEIIAIAA